ncbi:unnamed protein product, partial [Polarella glacialis]
AQELEAKQRGHDQEVLQARRELEATQQKAAQVPQLEAKISKMQRDMESQDKHWRTMFGSYNLIGNMLLGGAQAPPPPQPEPAAPSRPEVPPASGQSEVRESPGTASDSEPSEPTGPPTSAALPKTEPEQGKPPVSITLSIVSARGLRNADAWILGKGKSDPYVICTVRGKPGTKFKTKTVDDCLDPVWNESFDLTDFAVGDILDFAVWDEDLGTPDDALGTASLTSDQVFKAGGFEEEVPLQDAGKGIDARLLLRIQAPGSTADAAPKPQLLRQGQQPLDE